MFGPMAEFEHREPVVSETAREYNKYDAFKFYRRYLDKGRECLKKFPKRSRVRTPWSFTPNSIRRSKKRVRLLQKAVVNPFAGSLNDLTITY